MASKKIFTHIDLNQNDIKNFAIQGLSQAPANPVDRQVYFNTTDNVLFIYLDAKKDWFEIGKEYTATGKISLSGTQFSHETTDTTSTSSTGSVSPGGTFTAVDVVTVDAYGHVTDVKTKTVTVNAPSLDDIDGLDEVLAGKLGISNEAGALYATDSDGGQTTVKYGTAATGNNIVQRKSDGNITVPTNTGANDRPAASDAASVGYVQAKDNATNARIDEITAFGRYLTDWDPTGLTENKLSNAGKGTNLVTFPLAQTKKYEFKVGDYFLVSKDSVKEDDGTIDPKKNYMPAQKTSWGVADDDVFSRDGTSTDFKAGGKIRFDGQSWVYSAPDHHFDLEAFTDSQLGGIKGSSADGHISADPSAIGTAKVNGWDNVVKYPAGVAKGTALGGAAWKDVGDKSGNVAAGDHTHNFRDIVDKELAYPIRTSLHFYTDKASSDYVAFVFSRTVPEVFTAETPIQQIVCAIKPIEFETINAGINKNNHNYGLLWSISMNANAKPLDNHYFAMATPPTGLKSSLPEKLQELVDAGTISIDPKE